MVNGRIVGGDERQVVGVSGRVGGVRVMETMEYKHVSNQGALGRKKVKYICG